MQDQKIKKQPTQEVKVLFWVLVDITTKDCHRRDWAIIHWKSQLPFNQFSLLDLRI